MCHYGSGRPRHAGINLSEVYMNTPICDFTENYIKENPLRLHMPGHKGTGGYGADITEVDGADSLYAPSGIIRESEENASRLFGGKTFYSAEGSSHAVRAMLYLFSLYCAEAGREKKILAGRNAHKTFTGAAALLNINVSWLYPGEGESYLSCTPAPSSLAARIEKENPSALYLTSPDYLGFMADIEEIARICHEKDILLLVDNAHGAYLRFLVPSLHPLDLGADICCDSAHKTLPVLTGGAYLHIGESAPKCFSENAKAALSLFGSTSPSYLILDSLDRVNPYLEREYKGVLSAFLEKAEEIKGRLSRAGYTFLGNEPMKWTISAKKYGYEGDALAHLLRSKNIVCEFYDKDFLVLMLTPEVGEDGLLMLYTVLSSIPKKEEIPILPPSFSKSEQVFSPHDALFLPRETVKTEESEGRILAEVSVGCPPAVPILQIGERITKEAVKAFRYYGIKTVTIVKGF